MIPRRAYGKAPWIGLFVEQFRGNVSGAVQHTQYVNAGCTGTEKDDIAFHNDTADAKTKSLRGRPCRGWFASCRQRVVISSSNRIPASGLFCV